MAKDFRASQVETSKLIASGGITGTSAGLVIYSGSIASNRAGSISDSNIFSNVGSDVFLFVSGTASNTNFTRTDVSLFGGDVVISGTLYAERQVIEVDQIADGDFYVTGNMFIEPDTDSTKALTISKADSTNIFVVDTSTPKIMITGSVEQTGDLSLTQGSRLRFNNPGQNDIFIYANSDNALRIDGDDSVDFNADTSFSFTANSNSITVDDTKTIINSGATSADFYANTSNYFGTVFVDGGDLWSVDTTPTKRGWM